MTTNSLLDALTREGVLIDVSARFLQARWRNPASRLRKRPRACNRSSRQVFPPPVPPVAAIVSRTGAVTREIAISIPLGNL